MLSQFGLIHQDLFYQNLALLNQAFHFLLFHPNQKSQIHHLCQHHEHSQSNHCHYQFHHHDFHQLNLLNHYLYNHQYYYLNLKNQHMLLDLQYQKELLACPLIHCNKFFFVYNADNNFHQLNHLNHHPNH